MENIIFTYHEEVNEGPPKRVKGKPEISRAKCKDINHFGVHRVLKYVLCDSVPLTDFDVRLFQEQSTELMDNRNTVLNRAVSCLIDEANKC